MGKREKKIEEVQKKNIRMDYFLRNYFLLDLESEYYNVDVTSVNNKINEFEVFLANNNIKYKTHANFIKWCKDLKVIVNVLNEKNKTGEYERMMRKIVDSYQTVIDEQIKEKNKLVNKIDDLTFDYKNLQNKINMLKKDIKEYNFLLEKSKILKVKKCYEEILQKIKDCNIELNEYLLEFNTYMININLLKEKLFALDTYISVMKERLKDFESKLYIINNKNIINNIADRVIPFTFDDISSYDIYSGLVIVVTDKKGKKQPYANPFRIDELNNQYLNMLGEDARYLTEENSKNYKLIREDEYNEKYKK